MKLLVCGSRDFNNYPLMISSINKLIDKGEIQEQGLEIISGCARGADKLAIQLALDNDLKIHKYPANWSLGRSAGYLRNIEMLKEADYVIAFWDGASSGTHHTIKTARDWEIPIKVIHYEEASE